MIRRGGGVVVVLDVLVVDVACVDDVAVLVDDVAVLVDDVAVLVVVEAIVAGTEVVDAVVTSAVTDRSGAGSR